MTTNAEPHRIYSNTTKSNEVAVVGVVELIENLRGLFVHSLSKVL
jgi:hypothetical protein